MTNQTTQIAIGQSVKRVQPGDYTDGRIGDVLEIDETKARARVLWHTQQDYNGDDYPISKPLRTWVKFAALEVRR